jgi:hypothetical protein
MSGFAQFVHKGRLAMSFDDAQGVRAVYQAEVIRNGKSSSLEGYMADRTPYFYKEPSVIAQKFGEGYFISAMRSVLLRLPTAANFKESHFGEIISAVYAEEILSLRRLYSKLALLTAENANANKMDILFYRPGTEPLEFVLAEVKTSMKTAADGLPARHDESCFSSLFRSLNEYGKQDLEFDLAAISEHLQELPNAERDEVRTALLPHAERKITYAAFCVIDVSTHDETESAVLGKRKNDKTFDVDLLCVADLPEVVDNTYGILERARDVHR